MWNDIKETGLKVDTPVVVRQDNGIKNFACYHATLYTRGIVKLTHLKNGEFKWDGQTYLMKVTHWREIEPKELEENAVEQPATNQGQNDTIKKRFRSTAYQWPMRYLFKRFG